MGFNCPHCQKEVQNAVPLERFTELTNEKKAATEKVSSLERELQDWSRKEAGWKTREQLYGAGLTNPEIVDVAMLAYERLPADSRPAVTEWAKGHALFQSYFPTAQQPASAPTPTTPATPPAQQPSQQPQTPTQPTAAPQPQQPVAPAGPATPVAAPAPAGLPNSNATAAAGNAPAASGYTVEAIENMTLEQYREHRAAILGKKD